MTLAYDPAPYWGRRGRVYARRFHAERYVDQEAALRSVLARLGRPSSVLDAGCGFGRMGMLMADIWPGIPYTGLDVSRAMLARVRHNVRHAELVEASLESFRTDRRWGLVVASEVLMHIPPSSVACAVSTLTRLAPTLVTVDWTEPIGEPAAGHNFRHDYRALFAGRTVMSHRVGLQTIFVVTA